MVGRGWRPLAVVQLCTTALTLLLLIPSQLVFAFADRHVRSDAVGGTPRLGGLLIAEGISLLAFVISLLIYAMGSLVSMRLVVAVAAGTDPRIVPAARSALPRVPAMIGWSLLAGLITVSAMFACVLPTFYVVAVFAVLAPVVLFERSSAVSRCFRLYLLAHQ